MASPYDSGMTRGTSTSWQRNAKLNTLDVCRTPVIGLMKLAATETWNDLWGGPSENTTSLEYSRMDPISTGRRKDTSSIASALGYALQKTAAVDQASSYASLISMPPNIFPCMLRSCGWQSRVDFMTVSRINLVLSAVPISVRFSCSRYSAWITCRSSTVGASFVRSKSAAAFRFCLSSAPIENTSFSVSVSRISWGTTAEALLDELRATIVNRATIRGSALFVVGSTADIRMVTSMELFPTHVTLPLTFRLRSLMSGRRRSMRSTEAVTMNRGRVLEHPSSQCLYAMLPAKASRSSRSLPNRSPPNTLV
eukprot:Opistho-2@58121